MLWPFVWHLVPIKSISMEAGIPSPTIPARSGVLLGAECGRPGGEGRWPWCWSAAARRRASAGRRGMLLGKSLLGSAPTGAKVWVGKNSFYRAEFSCWKKSLWVSPGSNQELATATWYHSAARNKVDSGVRLCYTQYKDAPCKGCCKIKHSAKVLLWQNIADRNLRICIFTH